MPGTGGMADWIYGASANLYDFYNVDGQNVLGCGSFGKVLKGTNKVTGADCAIKQIAKSSGNHAGVDRQGREALNKEIRIMQRLDHPNIVRLFEHYEDNCSIYLVMELCSGGKLVHFLARMQDYRESDAALLMQQLLSAIGYVHEKHIVHRDVKPDNMLLESRSPLSDNTLKLVDFGLSCKCVPGRETRLSAGTPEFISPQAIDGRYDTQTDMWSCGASLYFLLCGYAPFHAETEAAVFAAVKRGNFTFSAVEWRTVSDDAKDLIRNLLKMNPRERYTADEALNHIWVRRTNAARLGQVAIPRPASAPRQRPPAGSALLRKAMSNFRAQSVYRKRPEPDASIFPSVHSVSQDVTKWANSLLPKAKLLQNS